MFFPHRITGIEPGHRVLDIGPGAHPFHRADVLLEMRFNDPAEYANQFGHDQPLVTDKELVFYDGVTFPFPDGAFDYVVCTHVLEHVPDPEHFVREVFRVGKRGYFEYPLAYYDLLYNINAHVNFMKRSGDTLRFMRKHDTHLNDFKPLQDLLRQSLEAGHTCLVDQLPELFIEGFQWEQPFNVHRVESLSEVCHSTYEMPAPAIMRPDSFSMKELLQAIATKTKRRAGLG